MSVTACVSFDNFVPPPGGTTAHLARLQRTAHGARGQIATIT